MQDTKPPEHKEETSSNAEDGKVSEHDKQTSSDAEGTKFPAGVSDPGSDQKCVKVSKSETKLSPDNSSDNLQHVQDSGQTKSAAEDPAEGEKLFTTFDCLNNLVIPVKKERLSSSDSESELSEFIEVGDADESPFYPMISGRNTNHDCETQNVASNGVPFESFFSRNDNNSLISSGTESSASMDHKTHVEPCPSALFKVRNSTDKKLAVRSNEPTVFMGRSRYFKYLYRDVANFGKLAMENKLEVSAIQTILNKVFSFSPATKEELIYERQHLETLFGDELVYDEANPSLTESESESESDSIEIIGEQESSVRTDQASRTVPACFQAGASAHN